MSNLLVTGAAGFIGSNYVFYHRDLRPDDTIVVLDALTYASTIETIKPLIGTKNFYFEHGDILDELKVNSIMELYKIDTIVHFAAESHVDRSIAGPDAFIKTNVEGTHNLLKAARKYFIKDNVCTGHFHHISTDEVYGTLAPEDPAFKESNPFRPNSPYSASKAASDCLVRAYVHTYGLNATVTNCSNNYGPRQFPEKLIPLCITNLLDGLNVPVYGDGRQIRDWLFVEDHARAIDLAIDSRAHEGTWNIGGRAELTNLEVIHTICDRLDDMLKSDSALVERFAKSAIACGKSSRDLIVHVTDRPGHDRRYAIDPTFANDDLKFKPSLDFARGIELTIRWYIDNENWWRPLKNRLMDFSSR